MRWKHHTRLRLKSKYSEIYCWKKKMLKVVVFALSEVHLRKFIKHLFILTMKSPRRTKWTEDMKEARGKRARPRDLVTWDGHGGGRVCVCERDGWLSFVLEWTMMRSDKPVLQSTRQCVTFCRPWSHGLHRRLFFILGLRLKRALRIDSALIWAEVNNIHFVFTLKNSFLSTDSRH